MSFEVSGSDSSSSRPTLTFACIDCGRVGIVTMPWPNSFHYGHSDDRGGTCAAGYFDIPAGWNHRINQLERCSECYRLHADAHSATAKKANEAESERINSLSTLELLDEVIAQPAYHFNGAARLKALRERLVGK